MSVKSLENPNGGSRYAYPSRFGSHFSMINELETEKLIDSGNYTDVVITDEYGDYVTKGKRLDDGLADPARFAQSRLRKLFEKSTRDKKNA